MESMDVISVLIKPLKIDGVVMHAKEILKDSDYLVRYKGSNGAYVSGKFKGSQLIVTSGCSENKIKFLKLVSSWDSNTLDSIKKRINERTKNL